METNRDRGAEAEVAPPGVGSAGPTPAVAVDLASAADLPPAPLDAFLSDPAATLGGRLRRLVLGISRHRALRAERGIGGAKSPARDHFVQVGRQFLVGYHAGLERGEPEELGEVLGLLPPLYRGFAFEGAAMAMAMLDGLAPRPGDRVRRFLRGAAADHVYIVHVGTGWAVARLPHRLPALLAELDPLLSWLAIDGYGCHQAYFHRSRVIEGRGVPRRLRGYARRAFDQGLGRGLWFLEGGAAQGIGEVIGGFPAERRGDLWSGVGLAATYAGGIGREPLEALARAAAEWRPVLAQGAAFGARARLSAHIPTPHVELACQVLCGCDAATAARWVGEEEGDLPRDTVDAPAFEVWRRRVQRRFAG